MCFKGVEEKCYLIEYTTCLPWSDTLDRSEKALACDFAHIRFYSSSQTKLDVRSGSYLLVTFCFHSIKIERVSAPTYKTAAVFEPIGIVNRRSVGDAWRQIDPTDRR